MRKLTAFAAGLLFGIGLLLSGMANPAKVIGFLDLAGVWNPSLALVMAGAIAVALLPFGWARRRHVSLLDAPMRLPEKRELDRRLNVSASMPVTSSIANVCIYRLMRFYP